MNKMDSSDLRTYRTSKIPEDGCLLISPCLSFRSIIYQFLSLACLGRGSVFHITITRNKTIIWRAQEFQLSFLDPSLPFDSSECILGCTGSWDRLWAKTRTTPGCANLIDSRLHLSRWIFYTDIHWRSIWESLGTLEHHPSFEACSSFPG